MIFDHEIVFRFSCDFDGVVFPVQIGPSEKTDFVFAETCDQELTEENLLRCPAWQACVEERP